MHNQSEINQELLEEISLLQKRILELEQSASERKRAEEALRENDERYRHIIETSLEGIWILNEERRMTFVNKRIADMLGYAPEEILGKRVDSFMFGEDLDDYALRGEIRRLGVAEIFERRLRRKDGTTIWIIVSSSPLFNSEGLFTGAFAMFTDITKRKLAEEEIQATLKEKDILLSEIHHRVKNNLQVICGLLALQVRDSKNPEVIKGFRESQNRIKAMALVHEKLYNVNSFSRIDLAGYVRTLSEELFQSCNINSGKTDLTIQADGEVHVDIIKAIPCGLIMNELISNALKHAFPEDIHGTLKIIIGETNNNEIEIVVSDNGLGLPDDVDIHKPRSVGLHLVNGLVKNQLDGQIEVKRDNGTAFKITFPL